VVLRLADAMRQLALSLTEADDFADAEAMFDAAADKLEQAPQEWSTWILRLTAEIHSGRALLDHRRGDEESALARLQTAAEIIDDAVDDETMALRVRIGHALAGTLGATGRSLDAAEVLRTIISTIDALVQNRVLPAQERAEVQRHLTKHLLNDGQLDAGLIAGQRALTEFERLNRTDDVEATIATAKAAAAVGTALIRLGDLPAAARIVQLWPDRLLDNPATADHPLIGQITAVLTEVQQLMAAGPADLPVVLTAAERFVLTAARMAASGSLGKASMLLEDLYGKMLWLKNVHPEHIPDQVCAEIALHLGITAIGGNRISAADRGLHHAQESIGRLVVEHGANGPTRQWLEAHEWRARLAVTTGDVHLAQLILQDLGRLAARWEPHRQDHWAGRINKLQITQDASASRFSAAFSACGDRRSWVCERRHS
jgi:tetratricopeptide (TPR) repeat protein